MSSGLFFEFKNDKFKSGRKSAGAAWTLLFLLPLLASNHFAFAMSEHFSSSVELSAAQSTDFWNAVQDLDGSRGSPVRLERTLRDRYGDNQDAFARLRIRTCLDDFYFEASGEGTSWAMTENPVVSELHARVLSMGSVSTGIESAFYDSALRLRLGVTAGMGSGKRIDGISTDLLEQVPQQQETVQIIGTDVGLRIETPAHHETQIGTSVDYQASSYRSNLQATTLNHRWKSITFARAYFLGIHLISGPQPIPVDILPRNWDYVHGITTVPELRALLGAGVNVSFVRFGGGELKAQGGIYGGYWGAGATFDARRMVFNTGTWGIGLNSIYQSKAERIWQGSFGLRF
ncbi:MAG: hypothetical protein A2Z97_02415 [Bdellovibrionales bacterium GWB1_52_6]|nr:MAG: hypothetical protein A2Z97_02415 [Bdellovibrionales bacterium GWB1_52_6]